MPCNALQRTATRCNALQRTAMHCKALQRTATHNTAMQHAAKHCNTQIHINTRTHTHTRAQGICVFVCGNELQVLQLCTTHYHTLQHKQLQYKQQNTHKCRTRARCRSPHPWLVRGSPHQIPNFGAGSRSPYQILQTTKHTQMHRTRGSRSASTAPSLARSGVTFCCSMLQRVAACCSVLQRVAVRCCNGGASTAPSLV